MGSIARIPKDQILDSALKMLIRDGYEALNIKTLAKELGCSTQPISWHFGSMPNLRRELTEAAFAYANAKIMPPKGAMPIERFRAIGDRSVDLAYDEPHLARFLTDAHEGHTFAEQFMTILDSSENDMMSRQIAELLEISEEDARHFIQTLILYTQGLVTMLLSDHEKVRSKDDAHAMVERVGVTYMRGLGVDLEKLHTKLGRK